MFSSKQALLPGPSASEQPLTRASLWMMAAVCGCGMAGVYLPQPLLATIAADMRVSAGAVSAVVTCTQIGFLVGLVGILPLANHIPPRRLVMALLLSAAGALSGAALVTDVYWLAAMSLLIGGAGIVAQIVIPLASALALPAQRGQAIGVAQSGMLFGILLARTLGGGGAQLFSWRGVYGVAAVIMVGMALIVYHRFPPSPVTAQRFAAPTAGSRNQSPGIGYTRVLVLTCLYGALVFGAYSAFWSTIAFMLSNPPWNYSSAMVGLIGLVGVGGVMATPHVGQLLDGWGIRLAAGLALSLTLSAFALLALGETQLAWLIVGALLLDIGSQASQVVNQARLFRLWPEERNRLNTIYMRVTYLGGVLGAAGGAYAWSMWGWGGICLLGAMLAGGALLVYSLYKD